MPWSSPTGWDNPGWSRPASGSLPFALGRGAPAAGTSPRITTMTGAASGSLLIASVFGGSASPTSFQDANGTTWNFIQNITGGGSRLNTWYAILTAPLASGASLGPNFAASQTVSVIVDCFPLGGTNDKNATNNGTSTTPTVTDPSAGSFTSQPQYVHVSFCSAGGLGSIGTPSGWQQLNDQPDPIGGANTTGVVSYIQRITATTAVTCAPTGHTNVSWAMAAQSFTTT